VSRLVSRQLIIFDTPVKDCKTKDNITVNIDVLIVLEVIQADAFAYGLGPEKLDSLLRAAQEEVLRQVSFEIPVENIYDLHGTDTEEWVKRMNANFEPYGVRIHHFTVRTVQIPGDMAKDFEDKTLYESKTIEKKVKQDSDRLNLNNEEACQKLKEECENARMAAEEQAVTTKAQIVKEVREVIASTEKEISVLEAQRLAEVADLTATTELEVAKTNAEILSKERDNKARVEAEVGRLEVEAHAYEAVKRSGARVEAAKKIAIGKKAIAEAEGEAVQAFAARRQQEQEMARLQILDKLAGNSKIAISTSLENNMGLAPDNSLVSQVAQQGIEAFRMKLAQMTASSVEQLGMGKKLAGGLVRPVPQQMTMG
jgi:regulator of protease activity HflC (stomatin/prohibitin superfamily)